ncbi:MULTISPECIES: phosphate propanoyltransferase [Brevibacillus]|jgi:putative phosphotransacetylase|uniref:phosphate propanoyltransferase n=1 Tax=Brevibacillus TaxID=55080 RepID=UPI0004F2B1F9|nr:phosphate propanoyltransferase [Brevibacillus borstelensis]KKX53767.1 propanediol utilization phosphotransacylase [Brevibacillus borstelensis cifa_chp40]MED2008728.1 phosphate propanoyltransferase [Brevibacillus borstelensis]
MAFITEATLRAMLRTGIPNPYPLHENDKLTPAAVDFLKGRGIKLEPCKSPDSFSRGPENRLVIPVGVSNRHVHLSQEDVEQLFGPDYQLTPMRPLSQPGQFAAEETVTLLGPKGLIRGVRILGPARGASQVEISKTDGYQLGVHPPIRLSGSIDGTPGITLIGPAGCVVLKQGVIVAKRHVHMSSDDAAAFDVKQGDSLILRLSGERSIIFPDVAVRIDPAFALDLHIDQDEANAANLRTGDEMEVIGKNGKLLSSTGR